MTIKKLTFAAISGFHSRAFRRGFRSAHEKITLFKIITVRDETVIGLTSADLDSIGGARAMPARWPA